MRFLVLALLTLLGLWVAGPAHGDVIEETARFQEVLDEAALDLQGGRWTAPAGEQLAQACSGFGAVLRAESSRALWQEPLAGGLEDPVSAAASLGTLQARLQHAAAGEMVAAQQAGRIEDAREWRAVIKLPKFASSVAGALALQRLGNNPAQRDEVTRMLAREFVSWQLTRAREKADALVRLIQEGRATPNLVVARTAEIEGLTDFSPAVRIWAPEISVAQSVAESRSALIEAVTVGRPESATLAANWKLALESGYPNLLTAEEIERRERIVLKLLRLIPIEYQSGVRNGEVVIPLEYREAKSFAIQVRQIMSELIPVWRRSKASALEESGPELLSRLEDLERAITHKESLGTVERAVRGASGLLQGAFGLALKRAGPGSDVVAETALEIRAQLGQSLAAALEGRWRKAEQLRLDAYINFDLEIEARALPRDPALALRAEKTFLEGREGRPGIKAALDRRAPAEVLNDSYQSALEALDECLALVKVGLSPTAAALSTVLIVAREGLEAVVILAALLAGLRGPENAGIRRRIGWGAWLALGASVALFAVSRTLLQGLSRYGETLEAVISVLAVIILLMVTNWVFHKYYWTGWNARLRELSKAAQKQVATRWENLALVGVGFMTIFREGFETTLFLQSLILEAGMRPVLIGLGVGGLLIAVLGYAVFALGARLPYRKMLVVTGVLVVFVLFTFLGSTVRIFQTIGWLPVHPIPGFDLPGWAGVWLGLYPTWEGLLIPFGAFVYVGTMWLWVKISSRRRLETEMGGRSSR